MSKNYALLKEDNFDLKVENKMLAKENSRLHKIIVSQKQVPIFTNRKRQTVISRFLFFRVLSVFREPERPFISLRSPSFHRSSFPNRCASSRRPSTGFFLGYPRPVDGRPSGPGPNGRRTPNPPLLTIVLNLTLWSPFACTKDPLSKHVQSVFRLFFDRTLCAVSSLSPATNE